MIQKHTTKKT